MESKYLLEAAELLKVRDALHLIIDSPVVLIGGKETQVVKLSVNSVDKPEIKTLEKIKAAIRVYLVQVESELRKLGVVLEEKSNVS